ncbi:Dynamin-related protein 3B [Galdieria sulphuraria]|uniref:Dynamin GTPase n=1 Tax=Galdieria sulphuraria TaxID=130081 RepID=M2Y393_GALSU|nr:dynamin GTPase [Galdieria sulphuraria]EME30418.1 dynamin GTPase [Galdieria sulphuraria]GJD08643.1 Dynamin-related protein 3B [Galdieria sulphuraria]|eukprot:XP_005706938.1 dynamin GTPase [Galdieria sulphuraria]
MEKLIPAVNKLQDVFGQLGLDSPVDLPQIMVVGSQSSGKSSVLEAFVGRDFLPRGSGIVTRRPTIVQMIQTKPDKLKGEQEEVDKTVEKKGKQQEDETGKDTKYGDEWVEFLHIPNKRFYDFEQVRQEIEAETDRTTGKNKGISPKPINLKVYSPNVVDLTVVDLPGLTKVPVGDQPDDIEKLIRAMIMSYIERPNAIVLAVHPANADLATSDALQMAKSVDPEGDRTIGVITKLDLMDKGTDALEWLQGKVYKLKRGYVGVVNRSQADINSHKTIQEAREAEKRFFKEHPVYKNFADQMGSEYLAKKLSGLLMDHIRKCLPDLRTKINSQLKEKQKELLKLGSALGDNEDIGAALLSIINHYAMEFNQALEGKAHEVISATELYGGARINYIFHDIYAKELDKMDPFEDLTLDDMRTAIRNATGHRSSLFIPEYGFDLLIKKQIEKFNLPAQTCVDLVYNELQRLAVALDHDDLARFERLESRLGEVTGDLLRRLKEPTSQVVADLVDMEISYINTRHPDFIGGNRAMTKLFRSMQAAEERQRAAAAAAQGQPQNMPQGSGYPPNSSQQSPPQGSPTGPGGRGLPPPNQQQQPQTTGRPSFQGPRPQQNATGSGPQSAQPQQATNQPYNYYSGQPNNNATEENAVDEQDKKLEDGADDISLYNVPEHIKAGNGRPLNEREHMEIEMIRTLLQSYFDVVRKNLQDYVPKAIMKFLVLKFRDELHSELVTSLYKEDNPDELLQESSETTERRKELRKMISILKRASQVINEVRESENAES